MITRKTAVARASDLIAARGIPLAWLENTGVQLVAHLAAGATQQQQADADAICAATGVGDWQSRNIEAIKQALLAAGLTTQQQATVWTNTQPLLLASKGFNEDGLQAMNFVGTAIGGLTTAEKNQARLLAVSMYAQDNPYHLVNPSWMPSLSVPGDEPVP